jgi:hypothetical protein
MIINIHLGYPAKTLFQLKGGISGIKISQDEQGNNQGKQGSQNAYPPNHRGLAFGDKKQDQYADNRQEYCRA